jgi:hypothetical protein
MLVYNVPAALLEKYPAMPVIVRSRKAAELGVCAAGMDEKHLIGLQLLDVSSGTGPIPSRERPVNIDLVLSQAANSDVAFLAAYTHLLETHDIVVVVPIAPGFSEAVRTAASLGFPVKLQIGALDQFAVSEVLELLDHYLHSPTQSRPVEFFHSVLQAVYSAQFSRGEMSDVTLWQIQEEDPAYIRYVADDGREVVSARLANLDPGDDLGSFLEQYQLELALERTECSVCPYFTSCAGYFKLPDRSFNCDAVKEIFHTLTVAARKLREDMDAYEEQQAQSGE